MGNDSTMSHDDRSGPEPASRAQASRPPARTASVPSRRREAAPPPFNLRVVRRAVARHWWRITLLWVVGAACLLALIYTKLKPSYEAVSVLRIEPAPRDLFGGGISSAENFEAYLQTQVQLVLSEKVLVAALADPALAAMPQLRVRGGASSILRKLVQVQVVPRTYLIEVSMKSPAPAEAAAIVNAVVAAYLDMASEWADGATRTHIASLEAYDQRLRAQIDEKQKAWLALADKSDLGTSVVGTSPGAPAVAQTTRRSVLLEQYRTVMDRLYRARVDLIEAENVLEARQERAARAARMAKPDPRLAQRASEAAGRNADVVALADQIRATLVRRDDVKRRTRIANDPVVSRYQAQIASLSTRYQQVFEDKRREILAQLEAEGDNSADTLGEAQEKVDSLRHSVARLEPLERQLESASKEGGSDAVRVALIRESLSSLREIEMAVVKRLEQLRFVAGGEPRISRINQAQAAQHPIKDSRIKYMAVAPLGLLSVLLALFLVAEVRADRVGDPEELSSRGQVEILGVVPPLPGRCPPSGQRATADYGNRVQELDQSLDHLRVALCGESTGAGGRCVLITSATGGEGKTNLAVQLAARCAKSGESTLLIDADLRRTVLGQLLDFDEGAGLSDVLNGDVPVEAALVEVKIGGFRLLPAGTLGHDPGRLLKGHCLGQLLARLRMEFDVIIVDTPPVLPVPDALILGRWCDGAILAVRHDNSRFPLVERAHRQLATAGVPVLGAVVTGLRPSRSSYGTYVYGFRSSRAPGGS